jgi:thioredoxin reductase (NADPH)
LTGETEEIDAGYVFVFIGASPHTDWLGPAFIRTGAAS